MATKYELCSQASILVGGRVIASFVDGTVESRVAGELYPAVVTELISMHPWRFATGQIMLDRRSTPPDARYPVAFELPKDVERLNAVLSGPQSDVVIRFDRYENTITCDVEEGARVFADVTRRIGESYWPGYFQTVVRMRLASQFAIPIAEDPDKGTLYEGQFLRFLGLAKTADSQGRTARKLPVGALVRYHAGRP